MKKCLFVLGIMTFVALASCSSKHDCLCTANYRIGEMQMSQEITMNDVEEECKTMESSAKTQISGVPAGISVNVTCKEI